MANRPQIKYVVTDQRSGKVIQNAKAYVYETGTTTLVADLFAAPTGGAVIASAELTSNAQGELEGYPTTPRNFALKVTSNGGTAYYAATGVLVSFPDFTEDPVPAYEDPVEEAAEDIDMMTLSTAQTVTGAKTFTGANTFVAPPAVSGSTPDGALATDYTVATIAARDAIVGMVAGSYAWVTNIDRVYRYDGAAWKPVTDVDYINVLDYGAHWTLADNSTAFNAAVAASRGQYPAPSGTKYSLAILIPAPPLDSGTNTAYYSFTSAWNLRGTANLLVKASGANRTQGGPVVQLNRTNAGPVLDIDNEASGLQVLAGSTFEGIYFSAGSTPVYTSGLSGYAFHRCSFYAGGDNAAFRTQNSFAVQFFRCVFINSSGGGTKGCLTLEAMDSTSSDAGGTYLVTVKGCLFSGGPMVEYIFNTAGIATFGDIVLDDCIGENQSGTQGLFLRTTKNYAAASNQTLRGVTIRNCLSADPTSGGSPWTLVSTDERITVQDLVLERSECANANSGKLELRSIAGQGGFVGVHQIGGQGIVIHDGAGARLAQGLTYAEFAGNNGAEWASVDLAGVSPGMTLFGGSGPAFARLSGVRGEQYARRATSAEGVEWWGSGAAAAADTNLYRSAANTLKTDDAFVAVGTMTAPKFLGAARRTLGPFTKVDFAGTGANVALELAAIASPNKVTAVRAGNITGLSIRVSEARTGGSVTAEVTINGAGTGLTAIVDGTNTLFKVSTQADTLDAYAAGDQIGVHYQTAGPFTPTGTNDLAAFVEVTE